MKQSSALLWFVLAVTLSPGSPFKKHKGVPPPLFGRILYGHPVPGVYSVPTPLSGYGPHYPVRAIAVPPHGKHAKGPVYIPPPAYPLSPPPTVYNPPPYPAYPVKPAYHPPPPPAYYPPPAYHPEPAYHHAPSYPEPAYQPPSYSEPAYHHAPSYPEPAYQPPSYPEYATQPPPTTYAPPTAAYHSEQPSQYPIPTTYDNRPWKPLPAEPLPYNEQPAQLIESDGYPWTPELENDAHSEAIKDKIPEVIFYPEKPIALVHSNANEVEFNPNPARLNPADVFDSTASPLVE